MADEKIAGNAAASTETKADDGRTNYAIRPGLAYVAGEKVRGRKAVRLTSDQARFDLMHERIVKVGDQPPASWAPRKS